MDVNLLKRKEDLVLARQYSLEMHNSLSILGPEISDFKALLVYIEKNPNIKSSEDHKRQLEKTIHPHIEKINLLSKKIKNLIPEYKHVELSLKKDPTLKDLKDLETDINSEIERCDLALLKLGKRLSE